MSPVINVLIFLKKCEITGKAYKWHRKHTFGTICNKGGLTFQGCTILHDLGGDCSTYNHGDLGSTIFYYI